MYSPPKFLAFAIPSRLPQTKSGARSVILWSYVRKSLAYHMGFIGNYGIQSSFNLNLDNGNLISDMSRGLQMGQAGAKGEGNGKEITYKSASRVVIQCPVRGHHESHVLCVSQ